MPRRFIHAVDLHSARKTLRRTGKPFLNFFSHGSLVVELYAPRGADKQTPHERDEVYVIASGSGTFRLGSKSTGFSRGDVLFAPAGATHRFTGFSDDFSTWVFFYGPQRGERGQITNLLVPGKRRARMATLKTRENKASVAVFLNNIKDPERRKDCLKLLATMKKLTGEKPVMWGTSIVGFGRYHYKYASGREGDWFITGFSPRKGDLTLYLMGGFRNHASLMKQLGKHKTGKSCLYIRSLDDVDRMVLQRLIKRSIAEMKQLTKS